MKKWLPVFLGVLATLPTATLAGESVLGTAGKILQIGIGPRQVAMGEANVAAVDDVYSLYWNPAGLASIRSPKISYMHNLWLQDIQDAYITYGQRMFKGGLGVSVNYFNFGEFEKIDVDSSGYPLPTNETFTPYTLVVSAGYGTRIMDNMDVGGTLRIINESVDTFSSMTLVMDLGMQYQDVIQGLDAGLTVQNLGVPLEGFPLPLGFKAGLAYDVPFTFSKQDRFLTVADISIPIPTDQPIYANVGMEYSYLGILAGRVGYKISEINSLGGTSGLTAGIGINYLNFSLDYAIAPFGDLGTTHRMALTYDFESGRKTKKKTKSSSQRGTPLLKRDTPGKTTGGVMLPPDKAGAGQVLLPTVSRMEMRQAIAVEVNSQINAQTKTKVDKAVFSIKISDDKKVKRWVLQIIDPNSTVVRQYTGKGNPTTVEWDGKGKGNQELKETIFCRYAIKLEMEDGTVETQRGDVVEKAKRGEQQTPNQEMLTRVVFDESSVDLSAETVEALKAAAKKIVGQPYVKIMIEGYTDSGTENPMSFLLSQRRADTVSRYMTATFKIPLTKISTHARGSKNPIASNQSEDGRKRNRRVEVTIIYRQ